jgi:serine/threonine protein kinase/Tol biopolymer transport system component
MAASGGWRSPPPVNDAEPMPLLNGTRIGPYEIVSALGAGGMGEVYRARDSKLNREVALKVLPDAFTRDPDRLGRFKREAQVLAALNHPNIAAIYGFEDCDGVQALVLELVEGLTLADRIAQGPIPLDDALPIARQVAEALEAAHEQGVIHRDLKPANVKLRSDGTVKVLDFGLAKLADPVGAALQTGPYVASSPTITTPAMTKMGVILGTAAYMSPEQAAGKPVDKRADIWAFGAVLWEMVTGKRLFEGETVAHTLASVLTKEPNWNTLPKHVQWLLRWCLEKDPKQRLRDIGDAKRLLTHEVPSDAIASSKVEGNLRWKVSAGAVAAVAIPALVLSVVHLQEEPPRPHVFQYTIPPPENGRIDSFELSPDGRYVAIGLVGVRGFPLWVRALDSLEARALPGTENATYPFWSPDSRYIGFFAQGKIKKIAISGGPAQILADAPSGRGATWNHDGVIVFSPAIGGGLSRVSASGGDPVRVTEAASGTHGFPDFLPDGRRFLYLAFGAKESGIYLASLDSKENRRLQPDITNPRYLPPRLGGTSGYLLFVREQTLMAQPVDSRSLDATGEALPVVEQVSRGRRTGDVYSLYSISDEDLLIYQTGAEGAGLEPVWFDRTGKELGTAGDRTHSRRFALAPDNKRVVVERSNNQFATSDLWILDLEHSTDSRLTVDTSVNTFPIWSPDGSRVMFNSTRTGGIPNLYVRAVDTAGPDELVFESQDPKFPFDWSRDGRFVIFVNQSPTTNLDVWALPLRADATGKLDSAKPVLLVQSRFQEWMGQLSPDGRWLAYLSDESGRAEVYVQRFSPAEAGAGKPIAGKWQVSTAGGAQPRWRGDGKEMFYVAPDRKLMSVEVTGEGETFRRTAPRALFELRANLAASGLYVYRYAPAADGTRFLVSTDAEVSTEAPPVNVVVNWLTARK